MSLPLHRISRRFVVTDYGVPPRKTLLGDDLSGPGSPERRNQSETSPVNTSVLTTPTAVTTATFPRFRQQVNEGRMMEGRFSAYLSLTYKNKNANGVWKLYANCSIAPG